MIENCHSSISRRQRKAEEIILKNNLLVLGWNQTRGPMHACRIAGQILGKQWKLKNIRCVKNLQLSFTIQATYYITNLPLLSKHETIKQILVPCITLYAVTNYCILIFQFVALLILSLAVLKNKVATLKSESKHV